MTKEELYKAAEERFNKHCAEDYCYPSRPDSELYKDGYKDGAIDICKKILEEVRTNEGIEQMTKFYIGEIIKNLGVKYD